MQESPSARNILDTVNEMAMIFGDPKPLESLAYFKAESRRLEEENERLQDFITVVQHESKKSKKSRPQSGLDQGQDSSEV